MSLKLNNVLHTLDLKYNLLSVQKLFHDNNCEVSFDSASINIKDKQIGTTLLQGSYDGGVYTLLSSSPVLVFTVF